MNPQRLTTVTVIVVVATIVLAGAAHASADLWQGFLHRHEASAAGAVYQDGVALNDVKVIYVRDNTAPDTCTQILLISDKVLAVPAHKDSCAF